MLMMNLILTRELMNCKIAMCLSMSRTGKIVVVNYMQIMREQYKLIHCTKI